MSPDQKEKFLEALLSAYPTRSSLELMLDLKLSWRLNELVGDGPLREVYFKLLRYADSQGGLDNLLETAHADNPGNRQLSDFYRAFFGGPTTAANPAPNVASGASGATGPQAPYKLVYSYASADHRYATELEKHLTSLVKIGLIERPWTEAMIPPGANRQQVLQSKWFAADVIVVLISADMLATGDEYMQLAERRHAAGALIVPVIIRPALWTASWIGKLQAYPQDNSQVKPISKWTDQAEGWLSVLAGIQAAIAHRRAEPG